MYRIFFKLQHQLAASSQPKKNNYVFFMWIDSIREHNHPAPGAEYQPDAASGQHNTTRQYWQGMETGSNVYMCCIASLMQLAVNITLHANTDKVWRQVAMYIYAV